MKLIVSILAIGALFIGCAEKLPEPNKQESSTVEENDDTVEISGASNEDDVSFSFFNVGVITINVPNGGGGAPAQNNVTVRRSSCKYGGTGPIVTCRRAGSAIYLNPTDVYTYILEYEKPITKGEEVDQLTSDGFRFTKKYTPNTVTWEIKRENPAASPVGYAEFSFKSNVLNTLDRIHFIPNITVREKTSKTVIAEFERGTSRVYNYNRNQANRELEVVASGGPNGGSSGCSLAYRNTSRNIYKKRTFTNVADLKFGQAANVEILPEEGSDSLQQRQLMELVCKSDATNTATMQVDLRFYGREFTTKHPELEVCEVDITPEYRGRIGTSIFTRAYVKKGDELKISVRPNNVPVTIRHMFDDGEYTVFTATGGELTIPNPQFDSGVHVTAGDLTCYGGYYRAAAKADTHADETSVPSKFAPPPVNNNPVIRAIRDYNVQVGQRVRFNVVATDADNDTLTRTCTGEKCTGHFWPKTGKYNWVPRENEVGSHTLSFRVSDGKGGSDTELVRVTVTPKPPRNQRPVIQSIASKEVFVGQNLTFKVNATDPEGGRLGFRCAGVPCRHFNKKTQVFSWTPKKENIGSYLVLFRAIDDKGDADSESLYIHVKKDPNVADYEVTQIESLTADAPGILLKFKPLGPNYGEDVRIVVNIKRSNDNSYQTNWDAQIGLERTIFVPRSDFDPDNSHTTVRVSAGIMTSNSTFQGFSPFEEVDFTK